MKLSVAACIAAFAHSTDAQRVAPRRNLLLQKSDADENYDIHVTPENINKEKIMRELLASDAGSMSMSMMSVSISWCDMYMSKTKTKTNSV